MFGEGRMKIALPVMGTEEQTLLQEVEECLKQKPDVIEWRIDHFLKKNCVLKDGKFWLRDIPAEFFETARKVLVLCTDCPLLVTFRTGYEGGEAFLSEEQYVELLTRIAKDRLADLIDVERYFLKSPGEGAKLCEWIRKQGIRVICSNHDFQKTPKRQEIVLRLSEMERMGADIAKIAVMPNSREDVLTLLSASLEADQKLSIPVITMSMGEYGVISRLAGNVSGSCLTFACAGKASAPGQLPVHVVKEVLVD